MTFEQLVINGRDICQILAKRLVDMYIDDNAATDIINGRLREVCPSLYSCHDEIYSKVGGSFSAHWLLCLTDYAFDDLSIGYQTLQEMLVSLLYVS